jgi:hypothetical protein
MHTYPQGWRSVRLFVHTYRRACMHAYIQGGPVVHPPAPGPVTLATSRFKQFYSKTKVCVYVCMYVCVCVYVYVYVYTRISSIHTHMHAYMRLHIRLHIHMHPYILCRPLNSRMSSLGLYGACSGPTAGVYTRSCMYECMYSTCWLCGAHSQASAGMYTISFADALFMYACMYACMYAFASHAASTATCRGTKCL